MVQVQGAHEVTLYWKYEFKHQFLMIHSVYFILPVLQNWVY